MQADLDEVLPEREHRTVGQEGSDEVRVGLRDLYKAMSVTVNPIPIKTAMNMAARRRRAAAPARRGLGGGARGHPRRARAARPARAGLTQSGTLRVLPLGGLGEIGKNMMVVEYDGRIVVVDTGLMFPTPDQLGIDLVLPDFAYLRERADDIEAIVLTHGHEDHVGALPFVLREFDRAPPIYGGPLTAAMVRSKLDEHRLKDVPVEDVLAGADLRRRSVLGGDGEDGALDPRLVRAWRSPASSARCSSPATTSSTRRPWTACRRTSRGWPSWGARALLLLCGDSTNADRPGMSPSESSVGPRLEEVFARCEGRIVVTCFASNIHRVQQVVDAAAALGAQGRAGRALDAQEREHRRACSGTSTCRRGCSSGPRRSRTSRTTSSS